AALDVDGRDRLAGGAERGRAVPLAEADLDDRADLGHRREPVQRAQVQVDVRRLGEELLQADHARRGSFPLASMCFQMPREPRPANGSHTDPVSIATAPTRASSATTTFAAKPADTR